MPPQSRRSGAVRSSLQKALDPSDVGAIDRACPYRTNEFVSNPIGCPTVGDVLLSDHVRRIDRGDAHRPASGPVGVLERVAPTSRRHEDAEIPDDNSAVGLRCGIAIAPRMHRN